MTAEPRPSGVKCVGAFLRPCTNLTDAILCGDCYAFIDKVMAPHRATPVRFKHQRRHGQA